jgi:hypothetical protein
MTDLFEQVLHHIEGKETEIQNWETRDGQKSYDVSSFGPDRWIERAALGRLMAIDLLAVILFSVRDTFDMEQERRIVESWAAELRKAATAGEIQARDPVTLLALEAVPEGWGWLVSMDDADTFTAARGMDWTPTERVAHMLEQCRIAGTRYLDPKTGELLKHYWLEGYEPMQPEPAQNTATPATVVNINPWLSVDPRDPTPQQQWYTPARYFARSLVVEDSTLLTKRLLLAGKVSKSLVQVGIYKRGGVKKLTAETVLKAFVNVTLG